MYVVVRGFMVEILGVFLGWVGVFKVLIGGVKVRDGDDKVYLLLFFIIFWRNKDKEFFCL